MPSWEPLREAPGTLPPPDKLRILLRGGGDIATGVALRLYRAGLRRLVVLEQDRPLAVRRKVAFSEAVYDGTTLIEGVRARLIPQATSRPGPCAACCAALWEEGEIPVLVDPVGQLVPVLCPEVLVEATLAKCNVGVSLHDAPLVIGLGPGFCAGQDVHCVVETNRGPDLGRVIRQGRAAANTGIPATVRGYSVERVLRAPTTGCWKTASEIGDQVCAGDQVGQVAGQPVRAGISGVIRGLLRNGTPLEHGVKVGDIDPRPDAVCDRVSDKALAIAGGVLEAILAWRLAPEEPGRASTGGAV